MSDIYGYETYGELLSALRKDLQLDGRTDILNGTVLLPPTGNMVPRTRVLGTVYQPNADRPVFVVLYAVLPGGGVSEIDIYVDGASAPTHQIGAVENSNAAQINQTASFLVPAGYYYKFVAVGGVAPAIASVYEYTL